MKHPAVVRHLALLLFCLPLTLPAAAPGAGESATVLIERTLGEAVAAVRAERSAIRQDPRVAYRLIERTLSPHVDFDIVARLVLGRQWRSATPEQRRRFTLAFREALLRTFATGLSQHVDQIASRLEHNPQLLTIRPMPAANQGERMVVRSELHIGAQPIAIDYRLHATDEGWKVYDVMIENVSFVTNYRAEYGSLVQSHGLQHLIEQIETKNRQQR